MWGGHSQLQSGEPEGSDHLSRGQNQAGLENPRHRDGILVLAGDSPRKAQEGLGRWTCNRIRGDDVQRRVRTYFPRDLHSDDAIVVSIVSDLVSSLPESLQAISMAR